MVISRTAGLAAAIALGVGISIAPAMATELPVKGGPGGSAFDQRCHKGEYLVGFHVRRGAWLDRIQILCAPHLQPRYQVGGRTFRGAPAGGPGGQEIVVTCRSSDTAVGRLDFTHTWSATKDVGYVTGLQFTCLDLAPPHAAATPAVDVVKLAPTGGGLFGNDPKRNEYRQPCPAGELAVGVRGRAGNFVDAMGLICGPAPKPPITAMGRAKRAEPSPATSTRVGSLESGPRSVPQTGTPPAPAQQQGFALDCRGGGKMKLSQDGNFVRISFKRAADGSARRAPRKGECAWTDRPVNDKEPTLLVYAGGDKSNSLIRAVKRGDAFRARAVNNNQGALVILDVD
jgi:hypothetical protein